jgi:ABC-type spermidine/putrescine transport system permease subunit II
MPFRRRRSIDWVKVGLGAWAALVYIFLFLPILFVVLHSFNRGDSFIVWGGGFRFSTKWYGRLFHANVTLRRAMKSSLVAATGSTVIATILGGLAGVALARRPGKWTKFFLAFVFLILVTPEVVDAVGYLLWFVKIGGPLNPDHQLPLIPAGYLRLWIGHSVFSSAVVALIVRARLAGLDESLEEAAADLGATPYKAFTQITLPLMAPALLAGALLSLTFSLDNVVIADFVKVPPYGTFPPFVLSSARATLRPDIGAAATIMVGITFVALGFVAFVLRRGGNSSTEVAKTLTGN